MKSILFIFCFALSHLFSQTSCKKIILKVCIDGETKLHIKNGTLFWEHIRDDAPGTNRACDGTTKVNDKDWKDWKTQYKLDFNTDNLTMQSFILKKNEISKLIQTPSASNGWETIWYFSDPSPLPHNYSMQFVFCPPGQTYNPKPKNKPAKLKTDTINEKKLIPKTDKQIVYTEDLICNINFKNSKTILTKKSEIDLENLATILKNNNLLIEISGYKPKGEPSNSKLYEDRSLLIDNFLVNKNIDQKRIKYIAFGESDKKLRSNNVIKCCIIIN